MTGKLKTAAGFAVIGLLVGGVIAAVIAGLLIGALVGLGVAIFAGLAVYWRAKDASGSDAGRIEERQE